MPTFSTARNNNLPEWLSHVLESIIQIKMYYPINYQEAMLIILACGIPETGLSEVLWNHLDIQVRPKECMYT